MDLVRTNNISSSTTWSSRPKELDLMGDRNVSAGRGCLCDPDSPDARIETQDNAEDAAEALRPTVRDFAAGKFSRLTLQIRAHDKGDASAWKQFNDAVLAVKYVALPAPAHRGGPGRGVGPCLLDQLRLPDRGERPDALATGKPKTAAGGGACRRRPAGSGGVQQVERLGVGDGTPISTGPPPAMWATWWNDPGACPLCRKACSTG
ncbi:hypothetical protein SMICM17S_00929 [Streptomyces microflavus]